MPHRDIASGSNRPSDAEGPAPKSHAGRVLVVDDEDTVCRMMARIVEAAGFEVDTTNNGASAQQLLIARQYEAVVSDVAMPGMDGLELLRMVRQHDLDLPVILVTGEPSLQSAMRAIEYGTFRYLSKPFKRAELAEAVTKAVQMHLMARLKRQAMELAGTGAAMPGDLAGLQARFDRALEELWVAYQPIVALPGQTVFAHEALVRTREPSFPHPGVLLSTAERLRQTFQLGERIRSRAVAPFASSAQAGLLFLNLHPAELLDPGLGDPAGVLVGMADRVVLEVTERASLGSLADVRSRVAELRAAGFRLAIDDLGAGYAGLTSFASLEPEFVKIDMSLVRDIDQDDLKRKLFASMAQLCRDMGIQMIAEGVETEAERDALLQLGCELFQGFLFARPGEAFPSVNW